jgi:3-hydroxyacyl-[acyl-carrier-protein] dehydratase
MLLVDAILHQDAQSIVCRKTFQAEEYFFQGHYPGFPLVPGVILCESAMQAGAILLSSFIKTDSIPVATRLNDVKFKRIVRPGETVEMEVRLMERLTDTFYLRAKVTCEGKLAARLDFACTLAKLT